MLKVYHAPNTRSIRVVWLLEELGVPYEKQTVDFSPAYLQSPAHLAVHPLGKLPAVDDDGLILNESGAIVQYILAKNAGSHLEPKLGTPAYGKYLQWLHFAEATFMPPVSQIIQHTFRKPEAERVASVVADAQAALKKVLAVLDGEISGKNFICGDDFTAADIMLGYDLYLCNLIRVPLDNFDNIRDYYARLSARPAFLKATGK
ncbi:MAG: glutathione S-transferase family protein [Parvibaculum sp.]|uniref:glutathione S-transferase family protein n=1 Tax=Parvibaculum sp. TaxID=2024848 RepID=UPI0025CF16EC|nr:glutathione S-transferase family protein [Parvibaculum sp.]MCE9649182.1 glutathione S-transferase family protein [Parvibaculum sp.]